MKRLLTVEEIAEYLSLSIKTIYQKSCNKTIPVCRISGKLLFDKEAIDTWISEKNEKAISTK